MPESGMLSVSLEFKCQIFWNQCEPESDYDLRIKVIMGSDIYQFLLEERDTEVRKSGVSFRVWGRSAQALLTERYSETITDTDETTHPWQSANVQVQTILTYILANYSDGSVSVTWNPENFTVYQGTFQASGLTVMAAIKHFAEVIGAEVRCGIDGNVAVSAFEVESDTPVAAYNDLDEIVQLSESRPPSSGFNAVTVYGYGSGNQIQSSISVTRKTDETIYPGRQFGLRVYYFHGVGDALLSYFGTGGLEAGATGIEDAFLTSVENTVLTPEEPGISRRKIL